MRLRFMARRLVSAQLTPAQVAMTPSHRWHDLGTRLASGIVLVSIAISSTRVGGDVFVVVWLAAAMIVQWEWQRLVGGPALGLRIIAGGCALLLVAIMARLDWAGIGLALLAFIGGDAALAGEGRRLWAASGLLYAGLFLVAVLSLRFSYPFGSRSVVWLFATVWSTDVFAYFGGRLLGGPKLWPRVSPSKTWSGTISGVTAGAIIGTYVALRDLPGPTGLAPVFCLTLVTAAVSQAGDAFESSVKRHFGVKDSSRLIPGHGGVMDRLDGFIAAAVFAFLFGYSRNLPSVALGLFYWA